MENLPKDIIENILLSRLSIESTLQSKRVCKTWRNLIGNKTTGLLMAFAILKTNSNLLIDESEEALDESEEAQVQLYYGDRDEVNLEKSYFENTLTKLDGGIYIVPAIDLYDDHHIVGSCNGILCLQIYNDLVICNPVTGESVFLPRLSEPENQMSAAAAGFGYLPSTNEYKVFRVFEDYSNPEVQVQHAEVYTLGARSGWRRIEKIPYSFYSSGIFANGAIHLKGFQQTVGESFNYKRFKIVAYDLADEKVKYVSLPPPLHYAKTYESIELMLLAGNLCVIHYRGLCEEIIDIWALKYRIRSNRILRPRVTREEYYDHNWSWSKEFSIAVRDPKRGKYRPFAITKSNEVLLWSYKKEIYCYDSNASTFSTKLWDTNGKGFACLQAIPHMNSLVSLKDLGECCNVTSDNDETLGNKIQHCKRKDVGECCGNNVTSDGESSAQQCKRRKS